MLEKISQVVLLKDFYGPLLTEKQQDVLSLHYENDWSLSEIAEHMHSSRQAVYDLVKRAQGLLEEYEEKLGLVAKFQQARRHLDEVLLLLDDPEVDKNKINYAVEILHELTALL